MTLAGGTDPGRHDLQEGRRRCQSNYWLPICSSFRMIEWSGRWAVKFASDHLSIALSWRVDPLHPQSSIQYASLLLTHRSRAHLCLSG